MKQHFHLRHLQGDIFGGLTAGIIALPLALAFGVQSGLGAIAGLYGAIALGFFAAIFAGTPTQISGPTGPMTVVSAMVIATTIAHAGNLPAAYGTILGIFLLAGALQIGLGIIKVGQYIRYIPYPVVSGFMTGIGIIIILLQLFPLMGHPSPNTVFEVITNIGTPLSAINFSALCYGLLTLTLIYILPLFIKIIPSSLLALLSVTLLAAFLAHDVPIIASIPTGWPAIQWSTLTAFKLDNLTYMLPPALMLAALGAIDSLLTSVVADNLTKTQHDSNRELVGQGIGNMAAALIGGIPGAGATMRTVVNIRAGARTRLSGVIHSLTLLTILLGAGKYAAQIPLSVLAGILIGVGISIIDYRGLRHITKIPRADAVIMISVIGLTVFVNLIQAVFVGVVLACVLFMIKMGEIVEQNSKTQLLKDYQQDQQSLSLPIVPEHLSRHIYIKQIQGPLFFGFASEFQRITLKIPDVKLVILWLQEVPYIDQSGIYAIEDAVLYLESRGIAVAIVGLQEQPRDMLRNIKIIPDLVQESEVFTDLASCIAWANTKFL